MEAVRNFTSGNRSTIVNVIYIVALLLIVYYIYKWWTAGNDLIADILPYKVPANALKAFDITDPEKVRLRVRTGSEYTVSFWMYITSWEFKNGLPKSVFQILDSKITTENGNYLMTCALYPNETKMMIRTYTGDKNDLTSVANFKSFVEGKSALAQDLYSPTLDLPQCDIQDIDLQRWIHTAVSVNGRIVDVYMDGKLARSCILPSMPIGNDDGSSIQKIAIGQFSGFAGHMSGIQFYAYAVTPDRIYATYQAGPYASASFLTYSLEKLGIKVSYLGAGGNKTDVGSRLSDVSSAIF
jgi:hypothetical protein